MATAQTATPTLDKLASVVDQRNAILHFLEWLAEEHRAELASYHKHVKTCQQAHVHDEDCKKGYNTLTGIRCSATDRVCGMNEETLYALRIRHEKLVMQFLGIDEKAVERERRALIEGLGK